MCWLSQPVYKSTANLSWPSHSTSRLGLSIRWLIGLSWLGFQLADWSSSNSSRPVSLVIKPGLARINQMNNSQRIIHLVNIESFVPIAMKYQAKTALLNSFRFVDGAVNGIHPLSWWKLIPSISSAFSRYITGLLTAINSSASIERVFSSFGLVHSRIRNRLGIEKAGKLVFIFRILNTGIISAEADNEEICM